MELTWCSGESCENDGVTEKYRRWTMQKGRVLLDTFFYWIVVLDTLVEFCCIGYCCYGAANWWCYEFPMQGYVATLRAG